MSFSEFFDDTLDFFENLEDRFRRDNDDRRREDRDSERAYEEENEVTSTANPKVIGVDFRGAKNAAMHKCEDYELIKRSKNTAIIRRGGCVSFEIHMNQDVDLKYNQELTMYFTYGPRPMVSKGTKEVLTFTGKKNFDQEKEDWDHRVVTIDGSKVVVEIFVPHDVPVGLWRVACETKNRDNMTDRYVYRTGGFLYILFNPWNKDDDVYMTDDTKRQEYVLNDTGKIWQGENYVTEWVFGQFDDVVLPACILLLQRSRLDPHLRGDPVVVARAITRMINANNDDGGVIEGKWRKPYDEGTSPTVWTGSIKILEEYMTTRKSVQYGQCWVFSGLTTTVCRALGLPCRSVTNLNSAHDTNASLTIDQFLGKDGEKYKKRSGTAGPSGLSDSIWNYHVWNDVWMARRDLADSGSYGGWQAIDSTPQESSDRLMQCGPASLEAIKTGRTDLKYDVGFILAEVNADVITWQEDYRATNGFRRLNSSKTRVGLKLLTKKVGDTLPGYSSIDKDDIKLEYKGVEGSTTERAALRAAAARGNREARSAFRLSTKVNEDIAFELTDVIRVPIGQDFSIEVTMKNTSSYTRTVDIVLCAFSEYYNGNTAETITKAEGKYVLDGGQKKNLTLVVKHGVYYDKLVESGIIKLRAIATVRETTQTWIEEDNFEIIKPKIKIKTPDDGTVGKVLPVEFSFKNPLDRILKQCILTIDGPGLTRPRTLPLRDVPSNGYMEYKINVHPKRSGRRTLVASFNSEQLDGVTGSMPIAIASD